jgi:uncharacterized cupredoxin-like copper-binding protein
MGGSSLARKVLAGNRPSRALIVARGIRNKELGMPLRNPIASFVAGAALLGLTIASGPAAWAQNATPTAEEAVVPRPVHIHSGDCQNLGEVVLPLNNLTEPSGDRVGQARRAAQAESSFTNVPMTMDAILGSDHAINVHLSTEQIGTYIACGEIGGVVGPDGSLVIGLRELNNSGYTGIAFLAPAADGASTNVSVFIAPVVGKNRGGGGGGNRAAEATPAAGGATTGAQATMETLPAVETPATTGAAATPPAGAGTGTPAAAAGGTTMMAGEQVPVSLMEFAITMPQTLPAGSVTFAVTNDGTITHSFEVEGNGIEQSLRNPLAPGETGMLTVDLTPGTYEVYCPIDDHRAQGMQVEVTVA